MKQVAEEGGKDEASGREDNARMKQVEEEVRQGRSKWQRRECKDEASADERRQDDRCVREGNARMKKVEEEGKQG